MNIAWPITDFGHWICSVNTGTSNGFLFLYSRIACPLNPVIRSRPTTQAELTEHHPKACFTK